MFNTKLGILKKAKKTINARLQRTFRGGIRLPDDKMTLDLPIEILPRPRSVYISLIQYQGIVARPVVKPGDQVHAGSVIAVADHEWGVSVHASIDGLVRDFTEYIHPVAGVGLCCVLDAAEGGMAGTRPAPRVYQDYTPAEIRQILKEAGVVGMGGAGFPTAVKLAPGKPVDTLIINGCESEPMITADYRLMVEYPVGVVEGARIFQKALNAERLIFAVSAIGDESAAAIRREGGEVKQLAFKFPIGSERQLIQSVLRRSYPRDGLPADAGVVVCNAATCYAGFQAVVFGKPLIERVVTVTGDGVREPKNLLAPIGTTAEDLILGCGGYAAAPVRIIFGGPMTGHAQPDVRVPITRETNAVLVLSNETPIRQLPCVRCGRCVDACPMDLIPLDLNRLVNNGNFVEAKAQGLLDCLECGSCGYVCPSRIPLVYMFRFGKAELKGMIP